MRKYRRISLTNRKEIHRLLKLDWNRNRIGMYLGFHPSTITRELQRNTGLKGYRFKQAQRQSDKRFYARKWFVRFDEELQDKVQRLIKDRFTPEQISFRLQREKQRYISPETIYRFIYSKKQMNLHLYKYLPQHHQVRRKKGRKTNDCRGQLKGIRKIQERPETKGFGHWERDSMLLSNRKSSVLVAVEKHTRFAVAAYCENHTADIVHQKSCEALRSFKIKTFANDQGREFAMHQETEKILDTEIYFCDAGKPYQRGLNKGTIALIRRYIPKKKENVEFTKQYLKDVMIRINCTPKKCLGWRTPFEVMFQTRIALMS